jgi:phage shock protein PspC (stress-responsive transcriptional regulator)
MNASSDYAASSDPSAARPAGQAGFLPLQRPSGGRMAAGVAAGVARSLGVDPVIVRVAFVFLALAGGAGLPLYLAGWLLIPDEVSGESLAAQLIHSVSANH